jgi:hypothetical protein
MKRTLNPGSIKTHTGRRVPVFVTVSYVDGRLSITGVEGPMAGGNCYGGCGQIGGHAGRALTVDAYAPGWTPELVAQLDKVWHDWHLNDMRAGSPRQRAWLAAHPEAGREYKTTLDNLTAAGLSPDAQYLHNGKPYAYGSAWLSDPVPADVIAFLESLPASTIPNPWKD